MAHLTNFSFEFFYKIFTEDASQPLQYHGAKKSKMTKNSNQGGPALKRYCISCKSPFSVSSAYICEKLLVKKVDSFKYGAKWNNYLFRTPPCVADRNHFPAKYRSNRKWRPTNGQADQPTVKFPKISSFDEFCIGLQPSASLQPSPRHRNIVRSRFFVCFEVDGLF